MADRAYEKIDNNDLQYTTLGRFCLCCQVVICHKMEISFFIVLFSIMKNEVNEDSYLLLGEYSTKLHQLM